MSRPVFINVNIDLPGIDYKHVDGMCGSWDGRKGNGRTDWRASPEESLFFYKAIGGKKCLDAGACNPQKKFKAQGGWTNLVFSGKWILFTSYDDNENIKNCIF